MTRAWTPEEEATLWARDVRDALAGEDENLAMYLLGQRRAGAHVVTLLAMLDAQGIARAVLTPLVTAAIARGREMSAGAYNAGVAKALDDAAKALARREDGAP